MQNINIGWTRNLSQILQLSGFKFSIIRITYRLKVLCVANSDTKILIVKLHTHCKNYVYLIVLPIFGHINAGKFRILGIFFANDGFLLDFGGIILKTRDIRKI